MGKMLSRWFFTFQKNIHVSTFVRVERFIRKFVKNKHLKKQFRFPIKPPTEIFRNIWPFHFQALLEITFKCYRSIVTSPEDASPFTVCSDPSSSLQPKWRWSCCSLYLLYPKGPPLSRHVPLVLSILSVGACPLLTILPETNPYRLSQVNLSPLRFESFFAELVSIFMGDWALSLQCFDTLYQSFGP